MALANFKSPEGKYAYYSATYKTDIVLRKWLFYKQFTV